jgi:hypothetical protein
MPVVDPWGQPPPVVQPKPAHWDDPVTPLMPVLEAAVRASVPDAVDVARWGPHRVVARTPFAAVTLANSYVPWEHVLDVYLYARTRRGNPVTLNSLYGLYRGAGVSSVTYQERLEGRDAAVLESTVAQAFAVLAAAAPGFLTDPRVAGELARQVGIDVGAA